MNHRATRLTTNQLLGLAAAVLGLGALLIGNPEPGTIARIDTQELAQIVQTEVDHITPVELADWIIRGRADYRLLDLRPAADYTAYHIPGAENVELTSLMDYGLQRNEKIVLYSDGGIHSAQAWFLLKARQYRGVYILLGGLDSWKDEILFPQPPVSPAREDLAAFEKSKEVSTFFGGTPRTGAASNQPSAAPALPKLTMPSAQAARPAAGASPKKKKEGC